MKSTPDILNISLGFLLLFILAGCTSEHNTGNSQDIESVPRTTIDSLNLLVGPESSQNISSPGSISILPNGNLAVLDTRLNKVLLFDSEGQQEIAFGERGKGPGEFVAPRMLQVRDSTINVIDVSLQRVNQYRLDGSFVQNYPLEREASHFGFITTGKANEYFSVTNGYQGKLIGHHIAGIPDSSRYIGEAIVKNPPPVNDKKAFYKSASGEQIPQAIQNDLLMDYHEGDLYVFLKSLSRLQKYQYGSLIWDEKLEMPANKEIRQHFFDQITSSESRFGILKLVHDLAVTNNHVYLLWNSVGDHPQTIVQVDHAGNIQQIFELPQTEKRSFSNLAVDPDVQRFYLSDPAAARIYTAKMD